MAVSRKEVQKSRILRALVAGGMDRRQMVRQLCKVGVLHPTSRVVGAFVWQATPQGHRYWAAIERASGQA